MQRKEFVFLQQKRVVLDQQRKKEIQNKNCVFLEQKRVVLDFGSATKKSAIVLFPRYMLKRQVY